jgi:ABC-type transport system involved in cytochrome c biogenesis permease subunit
VPQLVWGLGAWVCIGALALGRILRGLQARRAAILSAVTFASVMVMYVVFRVSTLDRGQFL